MVVLVNRAKMSTATTGTGTITLGAAVAGYQTFADAGVTNGQIVRYAIEDGVNWEIGTGTYTSSGTTLSRTVNESSNAGAAISLSGTAQVYITAAAADILQPDNNLSDLANAATARTNLGLGTIATQAANNVSITGGSITGITDLAVSDGGTGASSFTANNVLLGNGTSAFQVVAPGTSGNLLTSNGTTWTSAAAPAGYTNSDVDAHLNTSTATTGEVLSWNGTDYDWVSGGATDINGLSDGYSDGQSVGLGTGALANDDGTSNYNVAVGVNSSATITTGAFNTSVGYKAYQNGNNFGNTAIGYQALNAATSAEGNTAVGQNALYSVTTSIYNVAVGSNAGTYLTGTRNVAVGREALQGSPSVNLSGADNIGIGYQTGLDLSTGTYNFLGGYQAGANLTTGSNNVAIGNGALDAATTGGRNIAIGQDAMGLGVATDATGDNIAIGYQAGYDLTSGTDNVLIGELAGANITTASGHVAVGLEALSSAISSSGSTAVGYQALKASNGLSGTAFGYQAALNSSTSGQITALGYQAYYSTVSDADRGVAVGYRAMYLNTTGADNTAVGHQALDANTTGARNTAIGKDALGSITTGSNNVAIGMGALDAATTGGRNIAIGYDAMGLGVATSATGDNVAIGYQAGYDLTSGTDNVLIGELAGANLTTGGSNIAIGKDSMSAAAVTTHQFNVAIGVRSGQNISGNYNTVLGEGAGLTCGGYNTAIGYEAGRNLGASAFGGNVAVGAQSLYTAATSGDRFDVVAVGQRAFRASNGTPNYSVGIGRDAAFNVNAERTIAIGHQAVYGNATSFVTGTDNIGVGYRTGYALTTGANNFLGGNSSGLALTTGSNNVAIGSGALDTATTGGRNIAIGQDAMGLGVATQASGDNVAVGYQAGYDLTTGQYNVLLGLSAGANLTSAEGSVFIGQNAGINSTSSAANVCIGRFAGDSLTTGYGNIIIGPFADASSPTVLNEITLGDSSITRFRVPGVGLQFDTTDGLIVPKTITAAGTTGAQTINKTAGSVNFAAAATSLVVTNSFVDANSVIIATVATNDTTMTSVQAVAAAGSFTLYANAAATAETRVNWFVVN